MILQTLAWLGLLFFVGYQFSQRMMAKKGLILLWHLNESPVPHPRVWFGLVGLLLLVSLLLEGGLGLWGPSENRVLWELLAYLIKMFLLLGVMYRPWIRTAQKKLRFWVYKPLSWLELLRIFQLFCVSIFFYHACLFLLVSLDWPFQGMEHSEMETFLADSSWGATLFATLTVCVLAPFFEEAFFRKGLLSAMSKWVPVQSGLLITAIVFACFHPLSHFPLIVGLGYLFGWVYLKTGNLSASILLHVAWNTTMFLQLL
jgi:membrane protease YdiL (CAAX protease family)